MSDRKIIYLDDAINALAEGQAYYSSEDGAEIFYEYNHAIKALKNLPSAQQWIPCSERLPIGQTEVIASVHDDSGDTPFDYTASGWVSTDGEYWIVDNEINYHVVAWMQLPEPWKKGGKYE